jgi:hypothetical protein
VEYSTEFIVVLAIYGIFKIGGFQDMNYEDYHLLECDAI